MASVTKAANSHTVVTTGWTNPSNAYATTGNNVYATAAPAKNATVTGDFGFPAFTSGDIPDGATIDVVTVRVEWKLSVTTSATLGVRANNPAGTPVGNESTFSSATEAQTIQQSTSGITLADLRAGTVVARVRDTRGNTNTAHTGSLDFVSLTIDYTVPVDTNPQPGAANLTLTMSAPTVSVTQNQVVTPGAASLTITTSAPTVTYTAHKTVLPGAASLAITTSAPTVFSSDHKTVLPGSASLAITTFAPTVFASDAKVALPGAASLSITTAAPAVSVTDHKIAAPGATSLTLTPSAPTVAVSDHKVIVPGASALTLEGVVPEVTVTDHQWVVPGPFALVIETFAPEVTSSGQNTVEPGPAELVITMGRPTVTVSSWGAGPWIKEGTIHEGYPPKNH